MKRPLEHEYTSLVAYTRALEAYCDSLAQPKQTVAFLHEVVASDGEPDQALSFSPYNFPLQGVGGFKSVSVKSLVLASDTSQDCVDETAKQQHEYVAWMNDYNACKCPDNETRCFSDKVFRMMQKHTIPPAQRKPLTDEEITTCRDMIDWTADWAYIEYAKAIEAKIKEKT